MRKTTILTLMFLLGWGLSESLADDSKEVYDQKRSVICWGDERNGVKVGIASSKSVYTSNEPIRVSFFFTNRSDSKLIYYRTLEGPDLKIKKPNGENALRLAEKNAKTPGEKAVAKIRTYPNSRELLPHCGVGESWPIGTVWDMNDLGEYSITFSDEVKGATNIGPGFWVNSGVLKIKIEKGVSPRNVTIPAVIVNNQASRSLDRANAPIIVLKFSE